MKKINLAIYVTLLCWFTFALIFAFFDLEISKQFVNQTSVWANFLENYGMVPGLLVIMSGIYIYYSPIKQQSGIWSYFLRIIFF